MVICEVSKKTISD